MSKSRPAREASLRIRDVVERTGIPEATLRAWEVRHGFPEPTRLPSGHRRYTERDVELLRSIARDRAAGLPLATAVERARASRAVPRRSVFAGLRERRPELPVHPLRKRVLIQISHAIEDEATVGAEGLLLFASFQREAHYRAIEDRWREMSRSADAAVVFADFAAARRPRGGPAEVPITPSEPFAREWCIVCDAADRAACLVGWEPPGQQSVPDRERLFETIWTVDRGGAREAARICCELATASVADVAARASARLADDPSPPGPAELRRAEELTSRMIAYLGRDSDVPGASPR